MKKSKDFSLVYPRAVKYLSIRPRSVHEIRVYLARKGFASESVEEVVRQLISDKFLDDVEFARWWIRGRQAGGKAGFLIIRELKEKGIDGELIDNCMSEGTRDDVSVAREVVDKYHARYSKYKGKKYFEKMGAFLARRGFSYEVIRKCLEHKQS
jgi:regulatory protein